MENSELYANVGSALISLLDLRVKNNGRVDTSGGDKTPEGLGRTVERVLTEAIHKQYPVKITPDQAQALYHALIDLARLLTQTGVNDSRNPWSYPQVKQAAELIAEISDLPSKFDAFDKLPETRTT